MRPIVAGVDGTGTDSAAVLWAAKAAALHQVPLRLVHSAEVTAVGALEDDPSMSSQAVMEVLRREGQAPPYARDAAATVQKIYPDLPVEVVEASGAASAALVGFQDEALMIVVGSGQKGGIGQFLLGTTSLNTAMHATCPVAVVNREVKVTEAFADRVLVAVDGSRDSAAAAVVAFREAALRSVPVVCLSTWYLEVVDGYVVTEPDSPEWQAIEERQRGRVEASIKVARSRYPDVEVQVEILHGPSTTTLAAATGRTNLMVIGTRGRGGFAGKLLGSVSHKVLEAAACPVIVVKAPRD
ncbi:universal stress protein [Ornithinicoccus hortensis]|uniref:Nucleotide-binding universal stress UspA family protein n=1 Tax=Ornithinicoccus hortensis TaxID=82346 RepID=A0A542YPU1_9MICO|nr:nucleotide-binding universal stress UspA family protein [Ornithinicoccus hortensis]